MGQTTQGAAQAAPSNIYERLAEREWSQRDLADRTGIPIQTLNRRMRGLGKPFDIGELDLIADALGTTVSALCMPRSDVA